MSRADAWLSGCGSSSRSDDPCGSPTDLEPIISCGTLLVHAIDFVQNICTYDLPYSTYSLLRGTNLFSSSMSKSAEGKVIRYHASEQMRLGSDVLEVCCTEHKVSACTDTQRSLLFLTGSMLTNTISSTIISSHSAILKHDCATQHTAHHAEALSLSRHNLGRSLLASRFRTSRRASQRILRSTSLHQGPLSKSYF